MSESFWANSELDLYLFGGITEERDIMYERDSYSRAGDARRGIIRPDAPTLEQAEVVGAIVFDMRSDEITTELADSVREQLESRSSQ